jgi:hypothetical protein
MTRAAPPILAALLFVGLLMSLSGTVETHDRVSTRLSWDGDVSRIVDARCLSCHARERIPDLSTYKSARPWARAMREAVLEGHGYSAGNGAALTPFERELLVQWIDGGAPEKPKSNPVEYSRLPAGYTRIGSPDPLVTLEQYQARLGGMRTIIPGLGLSLRTADRIIVFDRRAGAERVIARGTFVPSLTAHLSSLPPGTQQQRVSDAASVIGSMNEPRTEVAEIAPEGPDRFWCPMHPDVRSPIEGTCPRCAMKLVEMPPMKLDAFALDVTRTFDILDMPTLQVRLTRGPALTLMQTGDFLFVHEERLHLFIVDESLRFFAHTHPAHVGESTISVDLPQAGRYRVIADFAPADALPQMRMASFVYAGKGARRTPRPATVRGRLEANTFKAGALSRVQFEVTPGDLEPYLGAAAHLFVIDETLDNPIHAHPIEVGDGGMARPGFDVRFPRAGRYVMWLQVQRAGQVETMRFTADVSK